MSEEPARPRVLIWIRSDPTVSGRVNEALRQAVGLAGCKLPVTVYLEEPAARVLREDPLPFEDGEEIEKHLAILRRWNTPLVSGGDSGPLLASADRFLRY